MAVFAISWGAILVRFCQAPPLVIAFYRLAFATAILLPAVLLRREWRALPADRGALGRVTVAGLLLAIHFATWISSLALTSVASSVVLVSTQTVFTALFSARALGERAPARLYLGVAVAVAGTALVAGADLALSPARLAGDLLALAGAATVAGYYVLGRRVRSEVSFVPYLILVYGTGALALGGIALAAGQPLHGHSRADFGWFLAMAAGPSVVGHSCLNWAVRRIPVYHANLATFGEPVLASIYAAVLLGERPSWALGAGAALILAGVALALPRRQLPAARCPGGIPRPGSGPPV